MVETDEYYGVIPIEKDDLLQKIQQQLRLVGPTLKKVEIPYDGYLYAAQEEQSMW